MADKMDPGPGFRLLALGEKIEKTDEYFASDGGWESFDKVAPVAGVEYPLTDIHKVVQLNHVPIRRKCSDT